MMRPMLRCALGLACLCCGLLATGCDADQQNGQECLKDDDCESRHCVARVCQQPGLLVPPSDVAVEAPADASDSADSAESAPDVPADVPTDLPADDASDASDAG
jgi:hypothetical protein